MPINQTLLKIIAPVLICAACLFADVALAAETAAPDGPRRHALIVGVSKYDNLDQRFQLRGPANDAALMRRVLGNAGFADRNITVLADGVADAGRPTRRAILSALEALTDKSERGDFVYFHFSGHGSQQPVTAASGPETDRFDEIILPADVGYWDGAKGFVENAIVDNEIGAYVNALRNKGVSLWMVFDSCHSGTMLRGVPVDGEREKRIAFMDLVRPNDRGKTSENIQQKRQASPDQGSRADNLLTSFIGNRQLQPDAAEFVAFYASQTFETTPELRLPVGQQPRRPHGLFTYVLASVLETRPMLTYRQLAEQVLLNYDAMRRNRPTPIFEGNGLDKPVFARQGAPNEPNWLLQAENDRYFLPAGSLQNIGPGSLLQVVTTATSDQQESLGSVEVIDVGLLRSELRILEGESEIRRHLENNGVAGLRMSQRSVDLTLSIALPEAQVLDEPDNQAIRMALDTIRKSENRLFDWVETGNAADLRLKIAQNRIWFVPPSGQWNTEGIFETASINIAGQENIEQPIRDALNRIAKTTNLLRLVNEAVAADLDLDISMQIKPRASDEFFTVSLDERRLLSDGDSIRFVIENRDERPVDLTMLFVDSRWGITPIYPRLAGEVNRIEPGGSDLVEGIINADTSTGIERVIAIAVPAKPKAPHTDFSFLAQASMPQLRSMESPGDFHQLLVQAGFEGGRTRGTEQRLNGDVSLVSLVWMTGK